jgi:membrane associated rhomboid family serine protease
MAFLQSAPPRQPIFRAPAVVLWLIGGLTALHALRLLLPPARSQDVIYEYALIPARYSHAFVVAQSDLSSSWPGTVLERAVPFLSYMGLHNDWTHLVINCLWLLAFGPVVARRLGSVLFLVFFLLCGLVGALAFLALNWGSPIPVVGASGAISGLMAAGLRMLPGQAPWVEPGSAPLAPLFSRQIVIFTAVWAAINLLAGVTGLGLGGESGLIAWQAHLGGFVAGLLLCEPFDLLRPRQVGMPLDR